MSTKLNILNLVFLLTIPSIGSTGIKPQFECMGFYSLYTLVPSVFQSMETEKFIEAVRSDKCDLALSSIMKGADVNAKISYETQSLDGIVKTQKMSLLSWAAFHGYIEIIEKLVENPNLIIEQEPNETYIGAPRNSVFWTANIYNHPFVMALTNGKVEAAKLLLPYLKNANIVALEIPSFGFSGGNDSIENHLLFAAIRTQDETLIKNLINRPELIKFRKLPQVLEMIQKLAIDYLPPERIDELFGMVEVSWKNFDLKLKNSSNLWLGKSVSEMEQTILFLLERGENFKILESIDFIGTYQKQFIRMRKLNHDASMNNESYQKFYKSILDFWGNSVLNIYEKKGKTKEDFLYDWGFFLFRLLVRSPYSKIPIAKEEARTLVFDFLNTIQNSKDLLNVLQKPIEGSENDIWFAEIMVEMALKYNDLEFLDKLNTIQPNFKWNLLPQNLHEKLVGLKSQRK